MRAWTLLTSVAVVFAASAFPAMAQDGPPPHVRAAVRAIEQFLEGPGDAAAVRAFVAGRIAPAMLARYAGEAIHEHLADLHAATKPALGGNFGVEATPEGLQLILDGPRRATILFVVQDDGLLSRLELIESAPREAAPSPFDGATWESLEAAFRSAQRTGFSGVVLARRSGQVVLREAFGHADRETGRPLTLGAVFDIGSTPINFTLSAAEILRRDGALSLEDPITEFFSDVPEDKRGMTVGHLVRSQSGLPDFIDREGDSDPDLAWIDRPTAVGRILESPLSFPPGTAREPSHAAIGLLAAIVEVVSGETYQAFVRERILGPLGMRHTGFYGEQLGLAVEDFAVGGGPSRVGLPNIPPNWGPTSWLIMGSGGMMSTLEDMTRYFDAVASGDMPFRESSGRPERAVSVGGSERGFFTVYVSDGMGSSILTLENGGVPPSEARPRVDALMRLVSGPPSAS